MPAHPMGAPAPMGAASAGRVCAPGWLRRQGPCVPGASRPGSAPRTARGVPRRRASFFGARSQPVRPALARRGAALARRGAALARRGAALARRGAALARRGAALARRGAARTVRGRPARDSWSERALPQPAGSREVAWHAAPRPSMRAAFSPPSRCGRARAARRDRRPGWPPRRDPEAPPPSGRALAKRRGPCRRRSFVIAGEGAPGHSSPCRPRKCNHSARIRAASHDQPAEGCLADGPRVDASGGMASVTPATTRRSPPWLCPRGPIDPVIEGVAGYSGRS
jgi:hypothetical protein